MAKIANKAPKETKVVSAAEKQEDYYKGFRSSVVLVWIFCNFALAAVVLSTAGLERLTIDNTTTQRSTIYMAVVLWSVAGLSLFRFCGAMWFLVVRLVSLRLPASLEFGWLDDLFLRSILTCGNMYSFGESDFGRWAFHVTVSVENVLLQQYHHCLAHGTWHLAHGPWRMGAWRMKRKGSLSPSFGTVNECP